MLRRNDCFLAVTTFLILIALAGILSAEDKELKFEVVNPGLLPAPPDDSPYMYARWNPSVLYPDGKTKISLQVWVNEKVKSVHLGSLDYVSAELNDSGIQGDKVAGDNIWTLGSYTRAFASFLFPDHSQSGMEVVIKRMNGKQAEYDLPSLGVVRKLNHKAEKIKRGVFATDWVVFLVDKKGKLLGGKFPVCDVKCGKGNEQVFQKFYETYPDKFDFLVVMPCCTIHRPSDLAENVPYCVPVKNKVKNIGVALFNNTAQFGSKGKLQSVIYHSFGTGAILDHEFGHNWGIRIGEAQGFSGATSKYGNAYGWHYSPYSNQVGQMAAHPQLKIEDNGDGTYKATITPDQPTNHPFTPLTLYQMGLIPPSEVPPAMFLKNPNYKNYNRIPAGQFDVYTIEEIMAANGGERQPAFPKTQKRFKTAFIVVTDHKPTKAEADFFSAVVKYFTSKDEGVAYLTPFYQTTGGRAKMKAKLPKVK